MVNSNGVSVWYLKAFLVPSGRAFAALAINQVSQMNDPSYYNLYKRRSSGVLGIWECLRNVMSLKVG